MTNDFGLNPLCAFYSDSKKAAKEDGTRAISSHTSSFYSPNTTLLSTSNSYHPATQSVSMYTNPCNPTGYSQAIRNHIPTNINPEASMLTNQSEHYLLDLIQQLNRDNTTRNLGTISQLGSINNNPRSVTNPSDPDLITQLLQQLRRINERNMETINHLDPLHQLRYLNQNNTQNYPDFIRNQDILTQAVRYLSSLPSVTPALPAMNAVPNPHTYQGDFFSAIAPNRTSLDSTLVRELLNRGWVPPNQAYPLIQSVNPTGYHFASTQTPSQQDSMMRDVPYFNRPISGLVPLNQTGRNLNERRENRSMTQDIQTQPTQGDTSILTPYSNIMRMSPNELKQFFSNTNEFSTGTIDHNSHEVTPYSNMIRIGQRNVSVSKKKTPSRKANNYQHVTNSAKSSIMMRRKTNKSRSSTGLRPMVAHIGSHLNELNQTLPNENHNWETTREITPYSNIIWTSAQKKKRSSAQVKRKASWRPNNDDHHSTDSCSTPESISRPDRPLSCYNLFARYERQVILNEQATKEDAKETASEIPVAVAMDESNDESSFVPLRYRGIQLERRHKFRENHNKTHGKIGFIQLTKEIGKRWREVDPETKSFFDKLAKKELKKYKIRCREYEQRKKDRS